MKRGRKYKLRKAFALYAEKMLKEQDIKEFTGEAGDVPSLVKAVSPISEEAGTKIFEGLCELYNPDMESAKHQKAKEMQKMLDEPLHKGQDFKTWAMEADMKLADVRLLGDAFEDKTVINGVIGKLKIVFDDFVAKTPFFPYPMS